MNEQMREKRLRRAVLCWVALAALELAAFWKFNRGDWTWDWVVEASPAGAALFAAGAVLLGALNILAWRTGSAEGDRSLGRYWTYCAVLAVLCLVFRNLDSAQLIFPATAMFSTPLGILGAALGTLPGGVSYEICCAALLVLSAGEILFHHLLTRRHGAPDSAGGAERHPMKEEC